MGKNSKKMKKEYKHKVNSGEIKPQHPTNDDIFEEHVLFGGMLMTKNEMEAILNKNKSKAEANKNEANNT
jgi:hypothetical protein